MKHYAIIDLFAGPGGLAEGFSSIRDDQGSRPFQVALSVENEPSAYQTLLLRAFLRQFRSEFPDEYYAFINGAAPEPDWSSLYPNEWIAANNEALLLELGSKPAWRVLERSFANIEAQFGNDLILIGGPPCQAYSLVGRARNKGIKGYKPKNDQRHFLYREYIRILNRLKPVAFVMENVKGLLSSSVDGERVFDQVLDDLSAAVGAAYTLVPLLPRSPIAGHIGVRHATATDFIVRAEDLGIPQARHRVIVVGIRNDIIERTGARFTLRGLLHPTKNWVTVRDVIGGMPALRSGLSDRDDTTQNWIGEMREILRRFGSSMRFAASKEQRRLLASMLKKIEVALNGSAQDFQRTSRGIRPLPKSCPRPLRSWLSDRRLTQYANHETRSHMSSDLERYFFASLYATALGKSPKAGHFPGALAPDHRSWESGKFADRFRVQLWEMPATTITSHISKDGHYFIHPDPAQCRSLTVREAARLQTFPDNYFFKGNRTQQYVQVGNAVPPFLARKIAEVLHEILTWMPSRIEESAQSKSSIASGNLEHRDGLIRVGRS